MTSRRQFLKAAGAGFIASSIGCARPLAPKSVTSPNILIYLSDTLRADHLSCYGHDTLVSPHIDRFAEESVLFENVSAPAGWTKPSIASLFTGLHPAVHRAGALNETGFEILRPTVDTLGTLLQAAGYNTAAFISNHVVNEDSGLHHGFERARMFANETSQEKDRLPNLPARFANWVASQNSDPWFAFLHEFDPHAPYAPTPETFSQLFGGSIEESAERLSEEDRFLLQHMQEYFLPTDPESERDENVWLSRPPLFDLSTQGREHMRCLYDAEIARVDNEFNNLLQILRDTNAVDNTWVVFLSDHGEGFGEHAFPDYPDAQGADGFFHGSSIHHEYVNVPLIVRPPGGCRGTKSPWCVSTIDLFPTLLQATGIPYPWYVPATPLMNASGEVQIDADREIFCTLDYHKNTPDVWDFSVTMDNRRLITWGHGLGHRMYDTRSDPEESTDILDTGDPLQQGLVQRLESWIDNQRELAVEFNARYGEPLWQGGTEEELELLRALGYLN